MILYANLATSSQINVFAIKEPFMKYGLSFVFLLLVVFAEAQERRQFSSFSEVLTFADQHSYTTKVASLQQNLAVLTRKTALGNVVNPRIPTTISMLDNTRQSVSFIPAEVFGGSAGSFKEITMGQQYVSTFNFTPQFDIFNLGNYARIKSAKINEEITQNTIATNKKNLFDQLNATYHNIQTFKTQLVYLQLNKQKSDSILSIVQQKYAQGLVRQQDLNDAQVNSITIADKIEQANWNIEQQTLILKTLCDTDEELILNESLSPLSVENSVAAAKNNLLEEGMRLQTKFLEAELLASKWQQLPVLSFVSSLNWQNNSNNSFFDGKWISSNYIGLRMTWDLPTNVTKLSNFKTSEINTQLAKINATHTQLQNRLQNEQLDKEYLKVVAQYKNLAQIAKLKADNFQKSQNQYRDNILGLDKLLLAQNDLIISQLNLATSLATIAFTKAKIEINNTVK